MAVDGGAAGHGHPGPARGGPSGGRRSFAAQQRRLAIATGVNVVIVVLQIAAGIAAGSVWYKPAWPGT